MTDVAAEVVHQLGSETKNKTFFFPHVTYHIIIVWPFKYLNV